MIKIPIQGYMYVETILRQRASRRSRTVSTLWQLQFSFADRMPGRIKSREESPVTEWLRNCSKSGCSSGKGVKEKKALNVYQAKENAVITSQPVR